MNSDDARQRLLQRFRAVPAAEEQPASEPEAGYRAYSQHGTDLRRREIMLRLVFANGNAMAVAYSSLVAVEFDPSNGVVLDFIGRKVRIVGRNLDDLFLALTAHRVGVVRELDELQAATVETGETVVTKIETTQSDDREGADDTSPTG